MMLCATVTGRWKDKASIILVYFSRHLTQFWFLSDFYFIWSHLLQLQMSTIILVTKTQRNLPPTIFAHRCIGISSPQGGGGRQTNPNWPEVDIWGSLLLNAADNVTKAMMLNVCQMTLTLFTPILTPMPFQCSDLNSAQPEPLGSNVPDNVWANKSVLRECFVWLLLCPEATVVWMRGLAQLMHSAGFMGFLTRPNAEWRRYQMEHLEPWLNNDYVDKIQ